MTASHEAAHSASEPSATGADPAQQHQLEQGRTMLRLMRARVKRSAGVLPHSTEEAADHARPYVEGWFDAMVAIDPTLADAMSQDVDAALCDPATSPTEQLTLLRIATEETTFASERGLGCVLGAHVDAGLKEDMVLWAGLEAWDAADLPVSEALERLARATSDTRTLRRLAAIRGESQFGGL